MLSLKTTLHVRDIQFTMNLQETWSHWYWCMNKNIRNNVSFRFNLRIFFINNVCSSLFVAFNAQMIFISPDKLLFNGKYSCTFNFWLQYSVNMSDFIFWRNATKENRWFISDPFIIQTVKKFETIILKFHKKYIQG